MNALGKALPSALVLVFLAVGPVALAQSGDHGEAPPAGHATDAHATPADAHGAHGSDAHGSDAHGDAHHGDAHHAPTPDWPAMGWHLFNVTLLFGLILYVARAPLMDEVRGRAVEIRKRLTEAARTRDEARQRHDELATRLARFDDELKAMKDSAADAAAQDKARLIEHARAEAERLAETAKRTIRDEVVRAQVTLRGEAVGLAVKLAGKTLASEVGSDDQKRLAGQFLDSVRSDEVNHG